MFILTSGNVVGGPHGAPQQVRATNILSDEDHDLALLTLEQDVRQFHTDPQSGIVIPLTLMLMPTPNNSSDAFDLGATVTTWGFPAGYAGQHPLLATGHLSGITKVQPREAVTASKFVINAAFNSGNSGGPVILVEAAQPDRIRVIGVVTDKHAPVDQHILDMLTALEWQRAGFRHAITFPDGSTQDLSEGQLIHHVLEYLRDQVQLVIGYATPVSDLRDFLTKHGIPTDLPDDGVRP